MKKTALNIMILMLTALQTMSAQSSSATSSDDITTTDTYAANSKLASGTWAKIRVSSTGICQLTSDVIRQAGFTDLSKVKIYGYGGNVIPDLLTQSYLKEHDDIQEVPTYTANGVKYFFAEGPVSWSSISASQRTRNYFSNYGYYFITQDNSSEGLTCTEEDLYNKVNAHPGTYHFLHEVDDYAWAQTGRNLVESNKITSTTPMTVNVKIPKGNTSAVITTVVSTGATTSYDITCGPRTLTNTMKLDAYYKCNFAKGLITLSDLSSFEKDADGNYICPVKISCNSDIATMRLDYIAARFTIRDTIMPISSGIYPKAQYFCNITNQNHHADKPADMIIIIPTNQQLLTQAQELAKFHLEKDGITSLIVPADELYNEFSSGTPDFSAYRRYLKMFYDRHEATGSDMPKYVLLFGDAVWDNRMITLPTYDPDDYLLCHETENSYYTLPSFSSDDYITILHDNQTIYEISTDQNTALSFDIGIGRIPVTTNSAAKVVVNKIKSYYNNKGSWQNDLFFFADDGDANSHAKNIDAVADSVSNQRPAFYIKKALADAYVMETTSTGKRYPTLNALIKKQQNKGALVMNYGGHSSWTQLSDEMLLTLAEVKALKGDNYSLWFTAGCETVPFDQTVETIGEQLLLNKNGGAIAFYGTTRTVQETTNAMMDKAFMRYVLSYDENGKPLTLGEAQRRAKNSLITNINKDGRDMTYNKHQFHLIGDPAMSLALPKYKAVIDYINDKATTEIDTVKGNSIMTVKGHITLANDTTLADNFNGTANILVRDSRRQFSGRNNTGESIVLTYNDRTNILYNGSFEVQDGKFSCSFKIPSDIYNDGGTGLINIFAYDPTLAGTANGSCGKFMAKDWIEEENDSVGPNIYAYFNTPAFRNGDAISQTPFFVAEVSDEDGLSTTGMALGHNMELVVDGSASMTYDLNDNFTYDKGSYTSGQTYYTLPSLSAGNHSLTFTAWDLLGNASRTTLTFNVIKSLQPTVTNVTVVPNPIVEDATFYVTHDMKGSEATINIDIIDLSGRVVQTLTWDDTFSESSSTSKYTWTPTGLSRGIYLYRVRVSCNGSQDSSMTQKLIIAQ